MNPPDFFFFSPWVTTAVLTVLARQSQSAGLSGPSATSKCGDQTQGPHATSAQPEPDPGQVRAAQDPERGNPRARAGLGIDGVGP